MLAFGRHVAIFRNSAIQPLNDICCSYTEIIFEFFKFNSNLNFSSSVLLCESNKLTNPMSQFVSPFHQCEVLSLQKLGLNIPHTHVFIKFLSSNAIVSVVSVPYSIWFMSIDWALGFLYYLIYLYTVICVFIFFYVQLILT